MNLAISVSLKSFDYSVKHLFLFQSPPSKVSWSPRKLRDILQRTSRTCRKLVSIGGTFQCPHCGQKCFKDGHKYVCLDEDVAPRSSDCIVLSFGVGENLSFDQAMVRFNCKVFAFELWPEKSMEKFWYKNLYLLNIGLGTLDVEV